MQVEIGDRVLVEAEVTGMARAGETFVYQVKIKGSRLAEPCWTSIEHMFLSSAQLRRCKNTY